MDITIEHIKQSNLIEGIDSPQEIEQSRTAWKELMAHEGPLNHGIITAVQRLITANQSDLGPLGSGYYRSINKVNVHVGGHWAPMWHMVEPLMNNWLLDFGEPSQEFDPIEAHKRFEWNHPFVDGNGRTGRMLLWWHQIKKGQKPILFLNSEKQEKYYPLFKGAA